MDKTPEQIAAGWNRAAWSLAVVCLALNVAIFVATLSLVAWPILQAQENTNAD